MLYSPVIHVVLANYLQGCDPAISQFFSWHDFHINFAGDFIFDPFDRRWNLELPQIVDRKVAKELSAGHIAGPINLLSFSDFKISPLGLVQCTI